MNYFYILLIFFIANSTCQKYRTATVIDGGSLYFTYSGQNNYFGNNVFRKEGGCIYNASHNLVVDTDRVLPAGQLLNIYFYAFPYTDSIRFFIISLTGTTPSVGYEIWIKSASQNPLGSLYTVNVASERYYVKSGSRMALGFESATKCVPGLIKNGYNTLVANGQIVPNNTLTAVSSQISFLGKEFAMAVQIDTGILNPIGPIGATGFPGLGGSTGFSGIDGVYGATGFTGFSGASGLPGYTGFTGMTGFSGFTGATGYTGQAGGRGATGLPGSFGVAGFAGYTGLKGYTGPLGSPGPRGITGAMGLFGQIGFTGQPGPVGQPGIPASSAPQGNTGATGPIGFTGDTGVTGDTGYSSYYTGEINHLKGRPGFNGPKGSSGSPGSTGPPGPIMRTLEDGSIGTCYLPQESGYEKYGKLRPICSGKPWPPTINLTKGELKLNAKVEFECIPSVLPTKSVYPFRLWTRNNRPLYVNDQNIMKTTTGDWSSRQYSFSSENKTLTISSLQPDDKGMWLNCVAGYGEFIINSEASLPQVVEF